MGATSSEPGERNVKTTAFARSTRGVYLRAVQDLSSPATSAIHHPKLIPVVVAAIIAVIVAWLGVSLSGWRRITWRDHMDTPVNLLPKEARWSGAWVPWKVFAHHEEVMHPSLVLLRPRHARRGFPDLYEQ
jgi:hypothetical protein